MRWFAFLRGIGGFIVLGLLGDLSVGPGPANGYSRVIFLGLVGGMTYAEGWRVGVRF